MEQHLAQTPTFTRREIIFTMVGVLCVMFLGTLDQTVTATALPRIVGELHDFSLVTWVTTAYLVSSTVTVPIYGKLSDQFGRKPILFFGLGVFLAGSLLSGLAQTMGQLVAFRTFQGIGAGALVPIASAIVSDLFPPRERAKWMGITASAYGLAAIIGPILGGWLTDFASWRWVFFVNLCVGVPVLVVLLAVMPTLHRTTTHASVDYLGALLLVAGTVAMLIGFAWAGSQYAWLSQQVLGSFSVAALCLLAFVLYEARLERRNREPILEPGLFRSSARIFGISMVMSLFFGVCTYGGIFFVPFFVQGVIGTTVTNSGLLLIPFAVASIFGAVLSGLTMSMTGRYKWQSVSGIIVAIIGFLLLLRLNVNSTNGDVLVGICVLGLGLGSGMAIYTTAIQNALPTKRGQVTAATTFFRQIGGAIGLSAMGSVVNAVYLPTFWGAVTPDVRQAVPPTVLAIFENPSNLLGGPGVLASIKASFAGQGPQGTAIFAHLYDAMKTALTAGMHQVFLVCLAVMLLAFVCVWFLREIPLRSRQETTPIAEVAQAATVQEEDAVPIIS